MGGSRSCIKPNGSSHKAIALMTQHTMTSISSMEWNKTTDPAAKYQRTSLGGISMQLNAKLYDVLLLYGSSIKCSAITSGQYQNIHIIEELYLITWNAIAGCQSSHCGCGGHCRGKDNSCKDWYVAWLRKICWLSQRYSIRSGVAAI